MFLERFLTKNTIVKFEADFGQNFFFLNPVGIGALLLSRSLII